MNNKNHQTIPNNIKFNNIEILRFLFSVIIVYYHLLNYSALTDIAKTTPIPIYIYLGDSCNSAYLIVEFFFIMAGFFLFKTFTEKEQSWSEFTLKKIARLWPPLAFCCIILYFSCYNNGIARHIMNMLFLQNIGITPDHGGFNWYISSYFWVIIFYFYLLKNYKLKNVNLVIALCVYFSLTACYNIGGFSLSQLETHYSFFNAGVLRALAGIGIGYFAGCIYNKIKAHIDMDNVNDLKTFTFFSTVEITCFAFLIDNLVLQNIYGRRDPFFIIVFLCLFICFLLKKGALSKILNNKYLGCFGKFSYSIYVMHGAVFSILSKTLWQNIDFVKNIFVCVPVSLIFTIIVGVLTYYLVEKPSAKYLKKKFNI